MSQHDQIDFEGSDDDIRSRFEQYVTQLIASIQYDMSPPPMDNSASK
jgi:hypothetical protein